VDAVGSQFESGLDESVLDEERALFEGRDPWAYGLKEKLAEEKFFEKFFGKELR
jgi:hypothetical protein